MEITKELIINSLKNVIDPDLNKDLVSLGMIENLVVNDAKKEVSFKLMLTTPACPLREKLKNDCIEAINKATAGEAHIHIELGAKVRGSQHDSKKENIMPGVKNIILVASGKGGVGKSTIAVNLAISIAKTGAKVGLIDADIYGPSIPLMFELMNQHPEAIEGEKGVRIIPFYKFGVKLISIGFFVEPEKALIWRGPMASNALKQLFTDVEWGELDYLIIDTPPGTGDIHLTLVQTLPIAGVAIVTTPQEVALADARKAINMFRNEGINVPVLGLIENMSFFTPAELPDNKYYIFGKNGGSRLAEEMKTVLLGRIPLVQSICESGDNGKPFSVENGTIEEKYFSELAGNLTQQLSIWNELHKIVDVEKEEGPCKCKIN
jgi:ATP-binding protein involved in chromosome partitioning